MKLGADFTKEILAGGKPPALTDEPDLEPGVEIEIKRFYFWITPLKQDKKGMWTYKIRDHRPTSFRMTATGSLVSNELATIVHDRSVKREPEPEPPDEVDMQRDRLRREIDVRNAWRQEQHRMREERMALEAKLPRVKAKGRRASVMAIEERLQRLNGRIRDAA